jgi:hypothetical protein
MKPVVHAKNSVRKFGGNLDDYMKFHNWMDSTKAHIPDIRHRMILHNAWGIFMAEQIFGSYFKNSDGKIVSVRDVLELHVVDDLGHIPTLEQCFKNFKAEPWMGSIEFRGGPVMSVNRTKVEIVE